MTFLNGKMSVKIIGLIFVLLMGGCAEETDIDTKIELLKKLAYEGDASAQYHLGLIYYIGNVVPKDYKKAYAWLNIAKTKPSVVEWTKNKNARITAETEKTNNKLSGKQKLKDLGLDDDEIQALTGA